MNDIARDLEETLVRPDERKLDALKAEAARLEAEAKRVEAAAKADAPKDEETSEPVVALDDIARIERRMEARRESIRDHLAEARVGVERTMTRATRSWPIAVAGVALAAVAVGYAVAQRRRPAARAERTAEALWRRARQAPEAARRYVHEATKPPSREWGERVAAGAGVAMAVMRVLPQVRALAATFQRMRSDRR